MKEKIIQLLLSPDLESDDNEMVEIGKSYVDQFYHSLPSRNIVIIMNQLKNFINETNH